jgi:ribosome-associated protein
MVEDDKFIELNAFLKINLLASTGGQAKNVIRSGEVLVNGVSEKRNRKKLHEGDIVEYSEKKFTVTKEVCKMSL